MKIATPFLPAWPRVGSPKSGKFSIVLYCSSNWRPEAQSRHGCQHHSRTIENIKPARPAMSGALCCCESAALHRPGRYMKSGPCVRSCCTRRSSSRLDSGQTDSLRRALARRERAAQTASRRDQLGAGGSPFANAARERVGHRRTKWRAQTRAERAYRRPQSSRRGPMLTTLTASSGPST